MRRRLSCCFARGDRPLLPHRCVCLLTWHAPPPGPREVTANSALNPDDSTDQPDEEVPDKARQPASNDEQGLHVIGIAEEADPAFPQCDALTECREGERT